MKLQTRVALIKLKPTANECIECGTCNKNCPMDVDVMFYIKNGKSITSTECILCDMCKYVCPVNAIK
jgi:MinD superfamily P-loop ATPase